MLFDIDIIVPLHTIDVSTIVARSEHDDIIVVWERESDDAVTHTFRTFELAGFDAYANTENWPWTRPLSLALATQLAEGRIHSRGLTTLAHTE